MRNLRVVLLTRGSVLGAGVQRLLQGVSGLDLIAVPAGDPQAETTVRQASPDVIVLDSSDMPNGAGIIPRVLHENPRAKVITLSVDSDDMEVYRMKRVVQTSLDGLLEVIQGKNGHLAPGSPYGQNRATRPGTGGEQKM